jgi:serine protease inhibitor
MFKYFPHMIFAAIALYLLYKWWYSSDSYSLPNMFTPDTTNKMIVYPTQYSNTNEGVNNIISSKIEPISNNDVIMLSKTVEKDNFNYQIINSTYENDNSGKSFLYSGLSLREALLMPYMGSTFGSSLFDAFRQLYKNNNEHGLMTYYCNLNKMLVSTGVVKIGNSIWNNGVNVRPEFLRYISNIGEVKNGINQLAINQWVSEKTNGMIQSVPISAGDIAMVIINALYFCDKWRHQFDKSNTKKVAFNNYLGKQSTLDMMYAKNDYIYAEASSYQAISLDYKSNFCMLVVLPTESKKPILLSQNEINALYESMRKEDVELYFPKFTYEDQHYLLQPILNTGYNITGAEYSTMTSDHSDRIYIGNIVQVTKIVVDEEGTKAAAVTAVDMFYNSAPEKKKKQIIFRADHSFTFYIIHKPTFEILFSGVFNG